MALSLSPTARICAIRNQLSCDLADETVILALEEGMYYGLNPVGASIWRLIQQPRTLAEIRDALLEEYAIDAQTCENEIRRLIEELSSRKLVEIQQ